MPMLWEKLLENLSLMETIDAVASPSWNDRVQAAQIKSLKNHLEYLERDNLDIESRHLLLRTFLKKIMNSKAMEWLSVGDVLGKDYFIHQFIWHMFNSGYNDRVIIRTQSWFVMMISGEVSLEVYELFMGWITTMYLPGVCDA